MRFGMRMEIELIPRQYRDNNHPEKTILPVI